MAGRVISGSVQRRARMTFGVAGAIVVICLCIRRARSGVADLRWASELASAERPVSLTADA